MPDTDVSELARRIQRMEDVHEINNLMGRRSFLHAAGRMDLEFEECFARDVPGMAIEAEGWGVWEGYETLKESYGNATPPPEQMKGEMYEHHLTTGVIEVAEDGKTAKGVWFSPGHETGNEADAPEPRAAMWAWCRYGVDFIKQDDGWKIWHLHIYTVFRTPYGQSWVGSSENWPDWLPPFIQGKVGVVPVDLPPAHRPTTFNQPYSLDYIPSLQPLPPRPYKTWDDTFSYTDPIEKQHY